MRNERSKKLEATILTGEVEVFDEKGRPNGTRPIRVDLSRRFKVVKKGQFDEPFKEVGGTGYLSSDIWKPDAPIGGDHPVYLKVAKVVDVGDEKLIKPYGVSRYRVEEI